MIPQLPERLRLARIEAGLNQTVIADACAVTQPAVSRWETGLANAQGCNEPDLASLATIARLTHKPVSWFLEGDGVLDQTPRLTADAVAAEAAHGDQLVLHLAGPDDALYQTLTVSAMHLHRALGIETPFAIWLDQQQTSRPFIAGQDYFTHGTHCYWSMDAAQGLALLTGTARGFAIWRALIKLETTFHRKPIVAPSPTPASSEPPALKVTPTEFIAIARGCLGMAHQRGLRGDAAVHHADYAATQLTGYSPRQLLGLAA